MASERSVKSRLAQNIVERLNVKNAKIIAICLVIIFVIFHGYRHLGQG